MASPATKNLSILLTDVKGFTEKTSHKSRAEILAMLEKNKELVLPVLEAGGGKLVKTIGDAFLMSFESPTDAVLAGVAVQDALRSYNRDKEPGDRIEVRVAINAGEVTLADNDVFGDPVNITARIESVAEAGEVFFTEAVYLAMNKTEVPSSEVGLLQLKGIPEKIRVYKVKREVPAGSSGPAGIVAAALKDSAKAKVISQVGAPAAAASGARPTVGRRAGALVLDWLLCVILAGIIFPGSRDAIMVNFKKKDGKPTKVEVLRNGIKVNAPDVKVNLGLAGLEIEDGSEVSVGRRNKRGMFCSITWFIYMLVALKWWGTTPGGKAFGLKVVRVDGAPLEKRDRVRRAFFTLVSGYCLGLGFLWALWEKDGRGWHDLWSDTKVVAA
jgi:class 3 adenylate cyclase